MEKTHQKNTNSSELTKICNFIKEQTEIINDHRAKKKYLEAANLSLKIKADAIKVYVEILKKEIGENVLNLMLQTLFDVKLYQEATDFYILMSLMLDKRPTVTDLSKLFHHGSYQILLRYSNIEVSNYGNSNSFWQDFPIFFSEKFPKELEKKVRNRQQPSGALTNLANDIKESKGSVANELVASLYRQAKTAIAQKTLG